MSGKNKIHEHPNANSNGFSKNKSNINKKGRPVSIRTQLKELLLNEGNLTIPSTQIVKVNDDGSIVMKVPTEMQLALKLQS